MRLAWFLLRRVACLLPMRLAWLLLMKVVWLLQSRLFIRTE